MDKTQYTSRMLTIVGERERSKKNEGVEQKADVVLKQEVDQVVCCIFTHVYVHTC